MGQKVNPISYRLQVSKDWSSKWFTRKSDFRHWLVEDDKIRKIVEERYKARPTIARVGIERSANLTTITISTAKAGAVIGKQGAGINELKKELEKIVGGPIRINVEEVKKPELNAKLVAENIAKCAVAMGGVDVITFTAGVGERGPVDRKHICRYLKVFGVEIDEEINKDVKGDEAELSTPDSKVKVWVIPTNEELMIARETYKLVK